jgi:hypothetical protein
MGIIAPEPEQHPDAAALGRARLVGGWVGACARSSCTQLAALCHIRVVP